MKNLIMIILIISINSLSADEVSSGDLFSDPSNLNTCNSANCEPMLLVPSEVAAGVRQHKGLFNMQGCSYKSIKKFKMSESGGVRLDACKRGNETKLIKLSYDNGVFQQNIGVLSSDFGRCFLHKTTASVICFDYEKSNNKETCIKRYSIGINESRQSYLDYQAIECKAKGKIKNQQALNAIILNIKNKSDYFVIGT